MTRLFLVGPRGGGKTTAARIIAARLGWDCLDTDAEVERRADQSIADIFAQQGEPAFRDLEAAILAELCERERLVVATGGGVVLRPDSRGRMREAGFVVWLHADADTLWARIQKDATTASRRPALAGGGRDEVVRIIAQREALYRECAHLRVDTSACTAEEAAETALAALAAAPSAIGVAQPLAPDHAAPK
jgi:shikimate kinase